MALRKTHKSAVVLVPPPPVAEPIQAIRRRYDRQYRRWMPHITLLYPFVPEEEFGAIAPELEEALAALAPFTVRLERFSRFVHNERSVTLWLVPEPRERLEALEDALLRAVPECDDQVARHGGFTPHLSVGQVRGPGARERAERLRAELEAHWSPVAFRAEAVSLIARGDPPRDVFRTVVRIPLGKPPATP